MFLALGVGAYTAAIFLVITHAFFKATLFLGAGTVIHGNGDNQDMRIMGGFRKFMPYTATGFVIAWLAIAGVPPFSGFFAKDGVLEKAYQHSDYGLWIVGLLAAILTGAYMTRQVMLTFAGNERWEPAAAAAAVADAAEAAEGADVAAPAVAHAEDAHAVPDFSTPTVSYGDPPHTPTLHHDPHEGSALMVGPVLAARGPGGGRRAPRCADPAVRVPRRLAGAGVPRLRPHRRAVVRRWRRAVDDRVRDGPARDRDRVHVLPPRVAARRRRSLRRASRRAGPDLRPRLLLRRRHLRAVDGPLRRFAGWLARVVDTGIIDGAVNGVAHLVRDTGQGFRRLQTGLVRNYAFGVVLGTAAFLLYLLVWAAR